MPLFAKGLRVVSITMMKNVVQPCAQQTILAAPARLQALLLLQLHKIVGYFVQDAFDSL